MANYALVSVASKLSFRSSFQHIMMVYESFMIEVDLYGYTIFYDYKMHSMLATSNTWFKNIWDLV
jgi:hypothetical protein